MKLLNFSKLHFFTFMIEIKLAALLETERGVIRCLPWPLFPAGHRRSRSHAVAEPKVSWQMEYHHYPRLQVHSCATDSALRYNRNYETPF